MASYKHNTGTFIGKGGSEIFFQGWIVENPAAYLVIAHGVGEHSGRYMNLVNELEGKRISIYALDHRGHGRSAGKRGHVDSFSDYLYDLKTLTDLITLNNEQVPLFLLGHSMGGVIATTYAQTYPDTLAGLVLSSPGYISLVKVPEWKNRLGLFLSRNLPSFTMSTGISSRDISHDADVVEARDNDPLMHDHVSTRWFTEFVAAGKNCLVQAEELTMPLLVFHGSSDRLVDYRGSVQIYEGASTEDKEFKLFDGFFHECLNEVDYRQATGLVARWIEDHLTIQKRRAPGRKHAAAVTRKKPAGTRGRKPAAKPKKAKTKKTAAPARRGRPVKQDAVKSDSAKRRGRPPRDAAKTTAAPRGRKPGKKK